ncbi:DUF3037 domain-containing protein [Trichococcus collinsii]|uniref:DUF3037 domain-containing protein n=1 Tax=Trichococcus collinsii TaxID=157076 RepID=A0AB37ZXN2_9LACT|nr:DUF3037 domain-containing protein [Trichococcus collinsii]CZR03259.1 Hypothetical protein Tcol_2131 [Trichococcus collinsii]SDZ98971.1 Protein of unknown function [Trichococcus collinsii]
MNKLDLYYAVCKYTPDLVRQETINVGIVIHCPNPGFEYSSFIKIKDKRRIANFDDEYDSSYFDMMFESLQYEFNFDDLYEDNFNNRFDDINSSEFLRERIKYYVNEIHFDSIKMLTSSPYEIQKDIEDLKSTYLYYEKPKGKRISTDDVRRLIKKQYKIYHFKDYLENTELTDFVGNPIFDYSYQDTYIKALSFDYKQSSLLYGYIKGLLYDINDNKSILIKKNIKIIVNNEDNFPEYTHLLNSKINGLRDEGINIHLQTISDYAEYLTNNGLS